VLKSVNHLADEVISCNHIINRQMLNASVMSGCLCFGAMGNFFLSLNCESCAVKGKLFIQQEAVVKTQQYISNMYIT
jgi:hypothetical protein